jgi:DNA-directed RNA polymerase subunit RPC12/RpoP
MIDLQSYGLGVTFEALRHMLRGHRVRWFADPEPWVGILGDVQCETCSLLIWIRSSRALLWLAQRLCGWLGHPGTEEWIRVPYPPSEDTMGTGCYCCSRCLADVPAPLGHDDRQAYAALACPRHPKVCDEREL